VSRVTASRLELLSRCGYFARDGVEWAERSSSDANLGTALHAMCDLYIRDGSAALAGIGKDLPVEDQKTLAAMWLHARDYIDKNRVGHWRSEIAFAYDPATDTAIELQPVDGHRDYSEAGPGAICGTADVVSVAVNDSRVVVMDWKSGSTFVDAADATAQLSGLALFAARAYDKTEASIATLRVTESGVTERWLDLDAFDLDRVAGEIAARLAAVPTAEPTPGSWCNDRWCPARLACPATTTALEQVIPVESLARFKMALLPESPAHAAWMFPRLKIAEEYLETLKANIYDMARAEPIDLGDGKELRETTATRRTVSAAKLEDLARRLGATDAQIASCASTGSYTQVRALVRKKGKAA
jgi:Protein of unknown function (DUF2800)